MLPEPSRSRHPASGSVLRMPETDTPCTDSFTVGEFLDLPRAAGLAVRPDGRRLVTVAATRDPEGQRYREALFELDPHGDSPPRRLTFSEAGESSPHFLPDGDLLFTSGRPDPDHTTTDDDVERLWLLPAGGGEARLLAGPPGGVSKIATAPHTGRVVLATTMHPSEADWEADEAREKARKDAGVTAQLFESYPVRHWNRWLGPRHVRLFGATEPDAPWEALDPRAHPADYERASIAVSETCVVATRWNRPDDVREHVTEVVAIDWDGPGAGRPRVIAGTPRTSHGSPACSPDGRSVVCVTAPLATPERAHDVTLSLVPVDGREEPTDLLPGFDRWPGAPVWSPDGATVYYTADDGGHTLPYAVDVGTGAVTRLASSGAFDSLTPAPDGSVLYAMRSAVDEPPRAVALDPGEPDQEHRAIPTPGDDSHPPGRVRRARGEAADGTVVAGWLVLPAETATPAPLAIFVHGGPLASWTGWHWRWNPHVLAARGWAVLLPDPALSTGYGWEMVQRGWGRWGAEPYTDLMTIIDAVASREDIDASRTAAMGGSFGGYMVNWIAGHTDRFDAIVTHASLWNLEHFHGTTDLGPHWEHELGDRYLDAERYREWSPHRFVAEIATPMLVIHGERDYRVPVSEGLSLWTDLQRHGVEAVYLHFPDEDHWIGKPQHVRLWYETVLAFLDHHVLGEPWEPPELLAPGSRR